MVTRDSIKEKSKVRVSEIVDVSEWGGKVVINRMSGAERGAWEAAFAKSASNPKPDGSFRERLLVRVLCGADGALMYKDTEVGELGQADSIVLDRLYDVAVRVNCLGKKAK